MRVERVRKGQGGSLNEGIYSRIERRGGRGSGDQVIRLT